MSGESEHSGAKRHASAREGEGSLVVVVVVGGEVGDVRRREALACIYFNYYNLKSLSKIRRRTTQGRPATANTSKKTALWSKIRLKKKRRTSRRSKEATERKKQSDERVSILLCFFCVSSGFWLLASGALSLVVFFCCPSGVLSFYLSLHEGPSSPARATPSCSAATSAGDGSLK